MSIPREEIPREKFEQSVAEIEAIIEYLKHIIVHNNSELAKMVIKDKLTRLFVVMVKQINAPIVKIYHMKDDDGKPYQVSVKEDNTEENLKEIRQLIPYINGLLRSLIVHSATVKEFNWVIASIERIASYFKIKLRKREKKRTTESDRLNKLIQRNKNCVSAVEKMKIMHDAKKEYIRRVISKVI